MTVLDSFSLADRVAVVTGTTRGLGRVLALALAEAGADIVHLNRSANEEVENACRDFGRASTSFSASSPSRPSGSSMRGGMRSPTSGSARP